MAQALGTIFAEASFSLSNKLFELWEPTDHSREQERHNKAAEGLQKEHEKWYQKRINQKTKLKELSSKEVQVQKDFGNTNKNFMELKRLDEKISETQRELNEHLTKRPTLRDFYKPSEEMKNYQRVTNMTEGAVVGWGVWRALDLFIQDFSKKLRNLGLNWKCVDASLQDFSFVLPR